MTDKRQVILSTASRLFYTHGYHAVGVDLIIAKAGVAKMTMYKYFGSKMDLISAVLKERDKQIQTSLHLFIDEFHDPLEKLKAIFTWHDRWFNENDFNGCMFISAAVEYANPDDKFILQSKQHKQTIQKCITDLLELVLKDEKRAQRLGGQLLQILEGAIITRHILNDRNAALTAWRTAAALLKAENISVNNV
jgi:AcrR family transcriptional regulator